MRKARRYLQNNIGRDKHAANVGNAIVCGLHVQIVPSFVSTVAMVAVPSHANALAVTVVILAVAIVVILVAIAMIAANNAVTNVAKPYVMHFGENVASVFVNAFVTDLLNLMISN